MIFFDYFQSPLALDIKAMKYSKLFKTGYMGKLYTRRKI